jgi:DnaK suppressor protein
MPRTQKASTPASGHKTTRAGAAKRTSGAKHSRSPFLESQRKALVEERASYTRQAEELKAQADSLALEHEPGDVQFDEEGGEGGTSNVDREMDLILSAQARAAIADIDRALAKIDAGTYGACEQCGQPIPEARLEALPHAALCVSCKSGGLSSRR